MVPELRTQSSPVSPPEGHARWRRTGIMWKSWFSNALYGALCKVGYGILAVVAFQPMLAYANPQGGTVSAGQATISSNGNQLNINQTTGSAVIDWRSFNIAKGELTKITEPSASSMQLDRVNDANPSQILGSLTANGHIVLVNPNGVFFGPGSTVDAAGIVATTANISNDKFMAGGRLAFNQPGNPNAAIVNQGTITAADAGLVGFVAPTVANQGVITAKLGTVALASGDTFTLDMTGDHKIEVAVSGDLQQQIVSNSGTIQADGGTIQLTAAAARNVVDSISNSGIIQANSVRNVNGRILLYAEGSNAVPGNVTAKKGQKQGTSTVLNSGTITATSSCEAQSDCAGSASKGPALAGAPQDYGKGGTISILGDNIGILSGSLIDASGATGGGTVKIGGDFHGGGSIPAALHTIVQSGTVIDANAITSGNGGNVTVWADDWTNFAGNIYARGGVTAGNGGFVETSG